MLWEPVPGADEYEVRLEEADSGALLASLTVENSTAQLDVPASLTSNTIRALATDELEVVVIAKSGSIGSAQANRSTGRSGPFFLAPPTYDPDFLRATIGTSNYPDGLHTNLAVYIGTAVPDVMPDFRVIGPPGWNSDQPLETWGIRGANFVITHATPPVDGEYLFVMDVDGATYTDSAWLDSSDVLPAPQALVVTQATTSRITAQFEPPEGADSVMAILYALDPLDLIGATDASSSPVIYENLQLDPALQYYLSVRAYTASPLSQDDIDFRTQFNHSRAETELFSVSPPEPVAVTVELFEDHERLVELAAFQNGDDPWRQVELAGGTFTFDVTDPAGRYGFAYVCVDPEVPELASTPVIVHSTTMEATAWTFPCPTLVRPGASIGTSTISGVVSGYPSSASAVNLFAGSSSVRGELDGSSFEYTLDDLVDGTYDVVAVAGWDQIFAGAADLITIQRDVVLQSSELLDIDLTDAFETVEHELSVGGASPGRSLSHTTTLLTRNGSSARLGFDFDAVVNSQPF